jgi:hypothetical protein
LRASNAPGLPERDEQQAPVVRETFERVLRGDALTRIAAGLNRAGKRPRRGIAWTHSGVQRLIASPALGGLVCGLASCTLPRLTQATATVVRVDGSHVVVSCEDPAAASSSN